jgi:hypothetical protein
LRLVQAGFQAGALEGGETGQVGAFTKQKPGAVLEPGDAGIELADQPAPVKPAVAFFMCATGNFSLIWSAGSAS